MLPAEMVRCAKLRGTRKCGFAAVGVAILALGYSLGCSPSSAGGPETSGAINSLAEFATPPAGAASAPSAAAKRAVPKVTSAEPHPLDKVAPLIPRDVLFGNPDKAMARISHDGKRLAYLAPVKNDDGEGVLNVFVGTLENPDAAKAVTHEKDRPVEGYFWAYTNKHLLYAMDDKGDENFHVFAVNLDTGKVKDITPLDPANAVDEKGQKKKVRAEIAEVSWRDPEHVVIGLNDRDPRYHDLYLVNITTGEKKLLQKNPDFAGFVVDEDYKVRFAEKMTPDGGTLYQEPDGKGGWKDFLKIGKDDNETTSLAGFNKAGDVLYLIDSRKSDTGELKTIDLKTGAEKVIATGTQGEIDGVMSHPTENTIQAVATVYDRTKWQFFDKEVEDDFHRLQKLGEGDNDIKIVSTTLDDRKWLAALLPDDGPVRYYLYDRDTKQPKFLFAIRPELADLPLQKMHSVIIPTRDGLKMVAYLTLPPGSDPKHTGRPSQPLPMVLDVHGGPNARDEWGMNAEHQLWANRGYVVLSVNYRGSTGFGKKFFNAGNREWAGKMHTDLLDAVDWTVKEKIADPKKVAILGGSYGGYATLVGLTFTPDVFACGIDEVGPSNLNTLIESIPKYWEPAIEDLKNRIGDFTTKEGKKFLWERSPLSKVDQIKRPLLIGQGQNDPRVNVREAEQIVKAMQAKKLPVTYVLFPDEGHGFARPENEMAFNAVSEAFLAKILGGRYEPIGTAFEGSTITVPTGATDVPGLKAALAAMPKAPAAGDQSSAASKAKE
ncbi:MAG TPA: S9 family peptidase [Pirellulales bacterium]|jgi:dipeptidyl aminopeptidase/acylaminoacyl peptidase|nr:S9 family peptidase [Pirellulales bacterium]